VVELISNLCEVCEEEEEEEEVLPLGCAPWNTLTRNKTITISK